MEEIINSLKKQFEFLYADEQIWKNMLTLLKRRELKSGEFLIEKGEVCKNTWFIKIQMHNMLS